MTPLRIVVIGVGATVWYLHEPAVRSTGTEVVGVLDADHARARDAAAAFGCPAVEALDELLALDADAAVVLTPHVLHADHVTAALEAGRHVLVEKPLASSPGDADRIVAAAERAGRVVTVTLQQRTRPEVQLARRLLADGDLGEVQRADLLAAWPRRSNYFEPGGWRGTWRGEGGGVLVNQAHHELDLLVHLVGPPAAVMARTSTQLHPIEAEDTAAALLEWPGRALGAVHVSTAEVDVPQRVEVTATGGRLCLTRGRLVVRRSPVDVRDFARADADPYDAPESGKPDVFCVDGGGHADVYRNLRAAIHEGVPLVAPVAEASHAVELAAAIQLSSHTGGRVALPVDRAAHRAMVDELAGPA